MFPFDFLLSGDMSSVMCTGSGLVTLSEDCAIYCTCLFYSSAGRLVSMNFSLEVDLSCFDSTSDGFD